MEILQTILHITGQVWIAACLGLGMLVMVAVMLDPLVDWKALFYPPPVETKPEPEIKIVSEPAGQIITVPDEDAITEVVTEQ